MAGITLEQLRVGDAAHFSKTISESDIYLYAGITGDFNPAHVNEVFAKDSVFESRIAHGMLTAGLISAILGNQLPGPGTIYMKQEMKFLAPVYIGTTITANVEVIEIISEKKRARLRTWCTDTAGTIVLEGEALVRPPE